MVLEVSAAPKCGRDRGRPGFIRIAAGRSPFGWSLAPRRMTYDGKGTGCDPFRVQGKDKEIGMLVLTRKIGERIIIGDDVVVTIVSVRGGHVSVGIDAPKAVAIRREELIEADAA